MQMSKPWHIALCSSSRLEGGWAGGLGSGTQPGPRNSFFLLNLRLEVQSGFITEDTIKEHLPPPGRFSFILVCGPPPLIHAVHPNLEKLGYTRDMIFTY